MPAELVENSHPVALRGMHRLGRGQRHDPQT